MGYKTSIQLLLVIVSVVMVVTYIRPTFEQMQKTQDETKVYQDALDNAAKFNQELQRLVNQANGFTTTQLNSLDRYLPDKIDRIAVMRDIETIVQNGNMGLTNLSSSESVQKVSLGQPAQGQTLSGGPTLGAQTFSVGVTGTYEEFKLLLQDLERSIYPLEVIDVSFSPSEDDLYNFALTLETYSLNVSTE